MNIIKIGYITFNTDDIIGKCSQHGGDLYDTPTLAGKLNLTPYQKETLLAGLWKIGFCAKNYHIEIVGKIPDATDTGE